MGKTSAFTRARLNDVRRKRDERMHRSQVIRDQRLGVDQSERQIQKVSKQRPLPSDADRKLLLAQWAQACRLVGPSADLCALMRHYAGGDKEAAVDESTRKRARVESDPAALNEMADLFLKTQSTPVSADGADDNNDDSGNDESDPVTVLQDMLQSDSGRRVINTLLECLHAVESPKCDAVAKVVLEEFEENEHLPEHHVACRVMSALTQHGSPAVQRGVLNLLQQRGTTLDGVVTLLTDRHTSVTVENLIKFVPAETTAWLCESLGLKSAAAKGSKKKSSKSSKKGGDNGDEEVSQELLLRLINDRMAGQVLRQLINATTRALFLERVDLQSLLETKRGTAFLTALLAAEDVPAETAVSMLDSLLEKTSDDLPNMCLDKRANFVVQKIIQLVPCTGKQQQGEHMSRLLRVLGGSAISSLAAHAIGVHVVATFIETALQLSTESADELGSMVVTRSNVSDLMCHQHGSLAVRRLMPLVKNKQCKTSQVLTSAIEQNMSTLLYDQIGNLVVQEYLKCIGTAGASTFARKLTKEDLLSMSRHPSASHVAFALLDLVDPATQLFLCNTLKPFVPSLATHLNGRFIVEKIIAANRDVREDLARQFVSLSMERGTQHVLTTLVANLDTRGKQSIVEKHIIPNLQSMATHACGSIVLQKVMQADPIILKAVQEQFSRKPNLRNDVAQSFYGKFVVQIAAQQE